MATAQEHPAMGYRQGMHEIASYLLFVLELEHREWPEHPLFNPILPICFALLERTLEQLKTAYDASGGKSLQQMSIAILGKVCYIANKYVVGVVVSCASKCLSFFFSQLAFSSTKSSSTAVFF